MVAHDDIGLGIIIPNPGEDEPKCLIFGSGGELLFPAITLSFGLRLKCGGGGPGGSLGHCSASKRRRTCSI